MNYFDISSEFCLMKVCIPSHLIYHHVGVTLLIVASAIIVIVESLYLLQEQDYYEEKSNFTPKNVDAPVYDNEENLLQHDIISKDNLLSKASEVKGNFASNKVKLPVP